MRSPRGPSTSGTGRRRARLDPQATANGDLGQLAWFTGDCDDLELPAGEFGHMPREQLTDQDAIIRTRAVRALTRLVDLRQEEQSTIAPGREHGVLWLVCSKPGPPSGHEPTTGWARAYHAQALGRLERPAIGDHPKVAPPTAPAHVVVVLDRGAPGARRATEQRK
jgi:hypothetical protein